MMLDKLDLTAMVKIEVVVEGDDVHGVTEQFERCGATGFTVISNVSGLGHGGYHEGRLLFNDRSALALCMVIVPEERASDIVEGVRALLEHRPGVLVASPAYVSRPGYFSQ